MSNDEKVCPRCAETIKSAAVVCRYCGHEFQTEAAPIADRPVAAEAIDDGLKTCKTCGNRIAYDASSCSYCKGASKAKGSKGKGCLYAFLAVIGFAMFVSIFAPSDKSSSETPASGTASGTETSSAPAPTPSETCSTDWSKCADNSDLVEHYSDWSLVQVKCKREANSRARYGTPEWPWIPFGSYRPGDSYVKTGIAVAIEKDAQFQNGFGAMTHSSVVCNYDLRAKNVLNVEIIPH